MPRTVRQTKSTRLPLEICILAGGQSVRMGRDKARLRLGRRTLLGHARATALSLGLPARVIRRDLVPRCGPLGGIFTALTTTRAGAVLFLSCDMPFVTPALLRRVIRAGRLKETQPQAVFTASREGAGFPFLIRREAQPRVEKQIQRGRFSLQALAHGLRAKRLRLARTAVAQLANLNTAAELAAAKRHHCLSQKARG